MKEAVARIKINKLLESAGWRFFADGKLPANIQLEPSVTLTTQALDALGENFEKTTKGLIDFLLLNDKGFPFIVLEAKSDEKDPLVGKEQARKYAKSQNCRFVLLSNGDLHYFWDLERGKGTWDEFLWSHAQTLWQCDFATKRMWTFRGFVDVYFLVFIHLGTRRCWISPSTVHPDSAWSGWQATLEKPEKLVRCTKKVGAYFGSSGRLAEVATQRGRHFLKNLTGRDTALTTPKPG